MRCLMVPLTFGEIHNRQITSPVKLRCSIMLPCRFQHGLVKVPSDLLKRCIMVRFKLCSKPAQPFM